MIDLTLTEHLTGLVIGLFQDLFCHYCHPRILSSLSGVHLSIRAMMPRSVSEMVKRFESDTSVITRSFPSFVVVGRTGRVSSDTFFMLLSPGCGRSFVDTVSECPHGQSQTVSSPPSKEPDTLVSSHQGLSRQSD